MRRFDKKQNIGKANLLNEKLYLYNKGLLNEREEAQVGTDSKGRPVYRDDENNYYIKASGTLIDVDPDTYESLSSYSSQKSSYPLNLTSQSPDFTPLEIKAKTGSATLVKLRHNETNTTKEIWVPNSQIKGDVIPSWIIKKNFGDIAPSKKETKNSLTIFGKPFSWDEEVELSIDKIGFKATIKYKDGNVRSFDELTEFHFRFKEQGPSSVPIGGAAAFESDIKSQGLTVILEDIISIEITM